MAFGVNIIPLTPGPSQSLKRENIQSNFPVHPISEEVLCKALNNLDFSALNDIGYFNHYEDFDSPIFPPLEAGDERAFEASHFRLHQAPRTPLVAEYIEDYSPMDLTADDSSKNAFQPDPSCYTGADSSFFPEFDESALNSPIEDMAAFTELLGTTIEELDQTLFGMPFEEYRAQLQAQEQPEK